MLKRIWIVVFMVFAGCLASAMTSVASKNAYNKQETTSNINKDVNEYLKGSRVFSGKVKKTGFWKSLLRPKYKYRLYDKDQWIACLDFNEKVRSPKVMEAFVEKNVIVKGSPQYINKEPYLVITVDEVSEQ